VARHEQQDSKNAFCAGHEAEDLTSLEVSQRYPGGRQWMRFIRGDDLAHHAIERGRRQSRLSGDALW
jgi:hypothetical protein